MKTLMPHNQKGFSLVEAMLALTVSGLVVTMSYNLLFTQQKTYNRQIEQAEVRARQRATLDVMTREIRMAGYDPAGIGFDEIAHDSAWLEFKADINGDGDIEDNNEHITYTFEPANRRILRTNGYDTQVFADNVSHCRFTCRDSSGSIVSPGGAQDLIREVEIATTVTGTAQGQGGPQTANTVTTMVRPRNLCY